MDPSVTRAGESLAKKGRSLLKETRAVIEAVRALDSQNDLLTIDLPVGLPQGVEQYGHRTLRKAAPSLRFRILYTDGGFNPDSSSHFCLHHGDTPGDPRWHHTRVAKIKIGLAASREYLESRGTPETVAHLKEHPLFVWERPHRSAELLPLAEEQATLISPNAALIRSFAAAGDGIALLPTYRFLPLLAPREALVPVLPSEVKDETLVWMSVRRDAESGAVGVLASAIARLIKTAMIPLEHA